MVNGKMAAYLMIVVHLLLVILHAAAHQILAVENVEANGDHGRVSYL